MLVQREHRKGKGEAGHGSLWLPGQDYKKAVNTDQMAACFPPTCPLNRGIFPQLGFEEANRLLPSPC